MKTLKRLGFIIGAIIVFFLTINIIPPTKVVKDNPFISKDGTTMIAAHRGGKINNPENTMKAFKAAVNEYEVDILESDLYLTKDGYLVYNHDSYIDRTCDVNGDISYEEVKDLPKSDRHYIKDYTLEELREFNFGYYFEDKDDNRIYKDVVSFDDPSRKEILRQNDLQIVEASELFEMFYNTHKDLLFIVEIKNSDEEGRKAVDTLYEMLKSSYPDYLDNIVIGTFHTEIEEYLEKSYKEELFRGASTGGAAKFIITEMLKVNIFDNSSFACLQITTEYEIKGIEIELDKKAYINRAHRRNIAVQYWTINEADDMRELIRLGCDAIMTDNPKLLKEVLEDMNQR